MRWSWPWSVASRRRGARPALRRGWPRAGMGRRRGARRGPGEGPGRQDRPPEASPGGPGAALGCARAGTRRGSGTARRHHREVWPASAIEYALDAGTGEAARLSEPDRWLTIEPVGSEEAYRDMVLFVTTVSEPDTAAVLGRALGGKGRVPTVPESPWALSGPRPAVVRPQRRTVPGSGASVARRTQLPSHVAARDLTTAPTHGPQPSVRERQRKSGRAHCGSRRRPLTDQ